MWSRKDPGDTKVEADAEAEVIVHNLPPRIGSEVLDCSTLERRLGDFSPRSLGSDVLKDGNIEWRMIGDYFPRRLRSDALPDGSCD